MKKAPAQSGQVLLVVLLVMVVGLTIGLSLATRSVTDIKISTQLEESSRAFAAAEAGIEAALKGEADGTYTIGDASYTLLTSTAGGTAAPLSLGKVGLADTYTVWLVEHKADGTLDLTNFYSGSSVDVCWGEGGEVAKPALEVTLVYKEGANYKALRGSYDPDDSGRRSKNNFADSDNGVACGGGFAYGKTVSLPSGTPVSLRLRPFYQEANTGVAPKGASLPSQGRSISSSGTVGGTTRRVTLIESYPSLPAIFDYVLFSGKEVSK